MSENQPINEVAVDRRAETVTTQQPGYAATEQVTRDVAAERRQGSAMITRIMYTLLGALEILLGIRFGAATDRGQCRERLCHVHLWHYGRVRRAVHRLNRDTRFRRHDVRSDHPHRHGGLCAALLGDRARDPHRGRSAECAHLVSRSTREQTPGGPGNERSTTTDFQLND